MERAGALPHVIEATLNHKVRGVVGVYRRHNFVEEKKDALIRIVAADRFQLAYCQATHGRWTAATRRSHL